MFPMNESVDLFSTGIHFGEVDEDVPVPTGDIAEDTTIESDVMTEIL